MKHCRKILCLLFCILLTGALLIGCTGPSEDTETESRTESESVTESESETEQDEDEPRGTQLSEYKVIYSNKAKQAVRSAAVALKNALSLTVGDDTVIGWQPVPEDNIEILVGTTNRAASGDALAALTDFRKNSANDYIIKAGNGKIVIAGGSDEATVAGVEHFIQSIAPNITTQWLTEGYEEVFRPEYAVKTLAGISPEQLTIAIASDGTHLKNAQELQARISRLTGYTLPIARGTQPETSSVIALGATINTEAGKAALGELTEYRKNSHEDWLVRADPSGIVAVGGSEEATAEAVKYLLKTAWTEIESGSSDLEFITRKVYPMITLGQKSIGDYTIVVPKNPSVDIVSAVNDIKDRVWELARFKLTTLTEDQLTDNTAPLIRISLDGEQLISAAIAFVGEDLVISGGHYYPVAQATRTLASLFTGEFDLPKSYTHRVTCDAVPLTNDTYSDMTLVWNDEFDYDEDLYDRQKWVQRAQMNASDMLNSTTERNVKTENGELILRSWKEDEATVGKAYSTNMSMTTYDSCNFCYGYLEMRAKVPFGKGLWPSFWMVQREDLRAPGYRAEIDIFEVFGKEDSLSPNIHKWFLDGHHTQLSSVKKAEFTFEDTTNLSNEYHTYGFYWDETKMVFSVDGVDYCEFDITDAGDFGNRAGMEGFHTPAYIVLNNFLFTPKANYIPDYTEAVSGDTEFPVTYTIDYIRLYQGNNGTLVVPNLESLLSGN